MNKLSPILLGLTLVVSGSSLATAQDQSMASVSVPKYIQITVEYTKPGKGGLAHDKTESAFVEAVTKAKFPIHYIAFNSLSGPARAIYMSHFDSFEAMQTANKVFEANAAEFERINVDDGELLESTKQLIFKYVPELSYHPHGPNPHAHYLEARILHVRSGHRKEFEDLVKMWMAVSDKAGSANHWGAYRVQYGDQVGTYVFLTSDNSMADIDNSSAEGPKFMAVLSEADRQVAGELRAEAIDADRFELYAVNPAQSYPPEEFIKADPDFWTPKAAAKSAMEEKKAKH